MKNMDPEGIVLRYKHNPNRSAFVFIFVISNFLIPFIIILTNDNSNTSSIFSRIYTSPTDGFSKFSYYSLVVLFILFNLANFISLYAQIRGWSELKQSSDGSAWTYSQYKKKSVSFVNDNLMKFELSRTEYDRDWTLFAKYNNQKAIKIVSGRQIPCEIGPKIAKKLDLELQIVDKQTYKTENKKLIDGEILILVFFALVILTGIIVVFFIV